MKVLTTIIVVGLIIWYLSYMSPENKMKRKKKHNSTANGNEEKFALSQDDQVSNEADGDDDN